ncbi:MAG TPA: hypothetical protein VJW51_07155 [Candidatus Acidoferrales bacterium]|nr:hypothetical protein [Candidatus Acidoferrales bacterium]
MPRRVIPFPPMLNALALCLLLSGPARPATPAPDKVVWNPVPNVLFRIDSKPAKLWTMYHAGKDKKEKRFLLQLGARYLMIDTQLRLITEYDPASFEKKDKGYEMTRDEKALKVLASEDWILRDVGTSFLIHLRLKDEGRLLEIQLPKMPDFRNVLW